MKVLTKDEVLAEVNEFLKGLQKKGWSLEPVLRSNAKMIGADFDLRALTAAEMPGEDHSATDALKPKK
jgi:hypothetical protein